MKIELEKYHKKELFTFGLAFIFFTLGVYSYMNITPCNDMFCFDPRPLLAIVWPIIGISFLIRYLILLKNKSRPKFGQNKNLYLLILLGTILVFLLISYKITFTDVGRFSYPVTYPHKFEAFKLLNGKFHICSLEKIDSQFSDDNCYTWWAKKFRTEYFCTKTWGARSDNCFKAMASIYSGLAVKENDYSICERAKNDLEYEYCIIPFIQNTDELAACNYVKNDFILYKDCILRYDKINESLCGEINLTKNECINEFTIDYNDVSYCYKYENIKLKDDCILNFIDKKNPKDCETYNITNDLCYYRYVVRNYPHNHSYCFKIESEKYRNQCLFYASIGNLDNSTCSLIDEKASFGNDIHPSASKSICYFLVKDRSQEKYTKYSGDQGPTEYWAGLEKLNYNYD